MRGPCFFQRAETKCWSGVRLLTAVRAVIVWWMFGLTNLGLGPGSLFWLWMGITSCVGVEQPEAVDKVDPHVLQPTGVTNATLTYENPALITGTIYPSGASSDRALFKFKRTVKRSGSTLSVLREYSYPDGKVAARERVVYRDNSLALYELDELQTGAKGSAEIESEPSKTGKTKIVFRYTKDASTRAPSGTRSEALVPDTLVNDMVGPFLMAHWDQLASGRKVGCRYIVLQRRETVGFTFRKESESQWHGKDVLVVKMEPTSAIISALVDPLHFIIAKAPPHHVLQYSGRTTPKQGSPGHWTDLDAVTVFDW